MSVEASAKTDSWLKILSTQALNNMALAGSEKILQLARVAEVAELVDAPDLGSGVFDVQVRVLSSVYFLA